MGLRSWWKQHISCDLVGMRIHGHHFHKIGGLEDDPTYKNHCTKGDDDPWWHTRTQSECCKCGYLSWTKGIDYKPRAAPPSSLDPLEIRSIINGGRPDRPDPGVKV